MHALLRLPLLTLTVSALFGLAACAGDDASTADADEITAAQAERVAFGEAVPVGEALTPAALIDQAESLDGKTVTVEGDVREVCQMAGCWLSLTDDAGRTVRVEVPRDESESYVYTFPRDASGRLVRITGMLDVELESVEDLRHYAEDAGASAAEVAAITEPQRTLVLTAYGAELAPAADAPLRDDA